MKNPAFLLLLLLFLSRTGGHAHPGHALSDHGHFHIVTSPYHVGMLFAFGVICFVLAKFLRQKWTRPFQMAGLASLFSGVLLWVLQH